MLGDGSVDVHAMRTTFGTNLSRAGVPLRTAQAAMRHSDPRLTANVYIDPALLECRWCSQLHARAVRYQTTGQRQRPRCAGETDTRIRGE